MRLCDAMSIFFHFANEAFNSYVGLFKERQLR